MFAGVAPDPNQSRTYEATSSHSSKAGSPLLQKTLFNITVTLLRKQPYDDPMCHFLNKKHVEVNSHYVYMTAGANKPLRPYYGRVKEYLASIEKTITCSYELSGQRCTRRSFC